jgi:hypothetical protein
MERSRRVKLAITGRIPTQWSKEQIIAVFQLIETALNLNSEGRIEGRHLTATSVPTTGDFKRGDIIWNSEPSAGGTMGWVCVTSGSPGTLKAFGDIAL